MPRLFGREQVEHEKGASKTNHPVLRVLPPSQLLWEIIDPIRNIEGLAEYRNLSSYMEKKCLYYTDKFNKKFRKDLNKLMPYQGYQLNCDDGDAFFI